LTNLLMGGFVWAGLAWSHHVRLEQRTLQVHVVVVQGLKSYIFKLPSRNLYSVMFL
jgi:hypothetical protein